MVNLIQTAILCQKKLYLKLFYYYTMRIPSIKAIFSIPRWRGITYSFLTKEKSSSKATIYKPLIFTVKSITWETGLRIYHNARIQGVKQYCGITFNPHIIFHENVSIQQNCHITCAERIEVGSETAIAAGVTITDIDHPYIDTLTPIEKQPLKVTPVHIGKDCKIYNNAVILNGTSIGNHCVIGANSVVKGVFPDFCIIVGSPGRIVKRYNINTNKWEKTKPDGSFINGNT